MSGLWIGPALLACFYLGLAANQDDRKRRGDNVTAVLIWVILAMTFYAKWH